MVFLREELKGNMPRSNKGKRNVQSMIRSAVDAGRTALFENEAEAVASSYGIKIVESGLAKNKSEAIQFARELGYPVVMKIVSKDILHKSDVGGVRANIITSKEAGAAYTEILKNVKNAKRNAKIDGILVQKMASKGYEFVVGATRDIQFGPTVMFGLGGIYVELFKDVSFRLAPLDKREALSMMNEIKASPLLTGFRGSKPLDLDSAARTIVAVGDMMEEIPQIQSIDINPLFVYQKGVLAVDVRIILSQLSEGKKEQEELASKSISSV